jgi:hypothetical protein
MGRALEIVSGFATNPGATLTGLTASTGLSYTVRGTDLTKNTWLLAAWAFNPTAGELRIFSARLHDQSQGIRNRVTANLAMPLVGGPVNDAFAQRLYAQDGLTVQLSGGGAEIDTASLLIAYEDLGGVAGRYIDNPTLMKQGINWVTAEVTVTATTDGKFGGAVAINSSLTNLIANTDYAVLGGMSDTRGGAVRVNGVDFGNLGPGFPAEPSARYLTQNWFQQLSAAYQAPYIPVFNSANQTAVNIDVQSNGSGGTYIVNLWLVQLAPGTATVAPATAPGTQPH